MYLFLDPSILFEIKSLEKTQVKEQEYQKLMSQVAHVWAKIQSRYANVLK
jgi:hypothetical protein